MAEINTSNYNKYHKVEAYNNVDELTLELVCIKHTDSEIYDLVTFLDSKYHRVRLTTSQIVQTNDES